MRKISSMILIAAFAALMFVIPAAGGLLAALTGGGTSSENRRLAAFPEVRAAADLAMFPARFSDWFEDRMPLKEPLVRLKSETEWALFRELDSDDVIAGTRQPWLFHRSQDGQPLETYKRLNLFTEEELQGICGNLLALRQDLAGENIDLVLLIVPDKEQIYGELYMPPSVRVADNAGRTAQLIGYLADNAPELPVVCPMQALKDEAASHELYYETDTHWNLRGASVGAAALATRVAAMYGLDYAAPPHTFLPGGPKTGDLQKLVKLGSAWDSTELVPETAPRCTVIDRLTDKNQEVVRESARSAYAGAVPRRIYLAGDSFRWNLAPFVEESFAESVVCSRYYFDTADLLMNSPDVLVYEIAERYLHELAMIPGYNTMALQLETKEN